MGRLPLPLGRLIVPMVISKLSFIARAQNSPLWLFPTSIAHADQSGL